ncbi:hypothetical protein NQZ68_021018, partial [Dissostichus eleginoides]
QTPPDTMNQSELSAQRQVGSKKLSRTLPHQPETQTVDTGGKLLPLACQKERARN